jgi:hypothetical protein
MEERENRNRKQQQVTKRISIFAKFLIANFLFVYVNLSLPALAF